ncbi:MAG: hypothetical protein EOO52_13735 [Gammaproteobacteria bacterium]|nr:MAG: hypothetical protein EOO52_13735 [Gammaproteobacteria bacterium]
MANYPKFDVDKVSDQAYGRWLDILEALAGRHLADAAKKVGRHVTCPVHGTSNKNGKGDGFRIHRTKGDEFGLIICHTCGKFSAFRSLMFLNEWSFPEALYEVAKYLGVKPEVEGDPEYSYAPATNTHSLELVRQRKLNNELVRQEASKKARERIDRVWNESRVIAPDQIPDAVEKYLRSRSVFLPSSFVGDHVRFHPALSYSRKDENGDYQYIGKYPALVKAVRFVSGEIATLHRTYFLPDELLELGYDKRQMMTIPDSWEGSAVQLGGMPTGNVLGVGEGYETCLSPMHHYQFPVWSALNTTFLETFVPPENVELLLVWVDKDRKEGGMKAATVLKERMLSLGKQCLLLIPGGDIPPDAKGVDWNDIHRLYGSAGFPSWSSIVTAAKKLKKAS